MEMMLFVIDVDAVMLQACTSVCVWGGGVAYRSVSSEVKLSLWRDAFVLYVVDRNLILSLDLSTDINCKITDFIQPCK